MGTMPDAAAERVSSRDVFMQFVGVLGPPVIWAIRFGVVYMLIPYICANGGLWVLHAITAATIGMVGVLGALSWRRWRSLRRQPNLPTLGDGRSRFMALTGFLSSAFFLLVILAEGLANFFIHPCQQAGVPIV